MRIILSRKKNTFAKIKDPLLNMCPNIIVRWSNNDSFEVNSIFQNKFKSFNFEKRVKFCKVFFRWRLIREKSHCFLLKIDFPKLSEIFLSFVGYREDGLSES